MSNITGQVSDYRAGARQFAGDRTRPSVGSANTVAQYTFAAGAVTPGTPLVLTVVNDAIGSLSGGNTWTPYDKTARYIVAVTMQTGPGNAAVLAAKLATSAGTITAVAGEAGVTGALNLHLSTSAIDFTAVNNVQVVPLVGAAVLADPTGTSVGACNNITITKIAVQ